MKKGIKRILLAVMVVMTLVAVPMATANDEDAIIWINLAPKPGVDVVWQDGRIYVPIRFIAENLDCEVEWKNGQVRIEQIIPRPKVEGDARVKRVVNEALNLLKEHDPAHYNMVCQNCRAINIARLPLGGSEFYIYANASSFGFVFSPDFVEDQKRFIPELVAGLMVHETAHTCWKMNDMSPDDRYNDENIAYEHEIIALELINAPQWVIDDAISGRNYTLNKYK